MGWLNGWNYRKSVTLSRASGAVTDYQMKLLVGESSGASGEDVDCGGLCQTDFDDLRFTTADGETLLDYWIESKSGTTPNQLATVWIEFDSIGTSATTFYMYYGNASASAASNGDNTFIAFDDFESYGVGDSCSKWGIEVASFVCDKTQYYERSKSGKATTSGTPYKNIYCGITSTNVPRVMIAVRPTVTNRDFRINLNSSVGGAPAVHVVFETDAKIKHYNGSTWTTIQSYTKDTWYFLEIRNLNFTTKKFDLLINGTLKVNQGAFWNTSANDVSLVLMYHDSSAVYSWYVDMLRVGKFYSTEPAWGAWGGQESARRGRSIYVPNVSWLSKSLQKRREI